MNKKNNIISLVSIFIFGIVLFLYGYSNTIKGITNPENISIKKEIQGNKVGNNFEKAKKKLEANVYNDKVLGMVEIYCGCKYDKTKKTIDCPFKPTTKSDRGLKVEWEHVVPAENFGKSFSEWTNGSSACTKKGIKGGRECAKLNSDFARMEGDMYNLYPANGELNGLRSNRDYGIVNPNGAKVKNFKECSVKLDYEKDKFEPKEEYKGELARVYFYMAKTYPEKVKLNDIKKTLFEKWDKDHPISISECKRYQVIKSIQGTENTILSDYCNK